MRDGFGDHMVVRRVVFDLVQAVSPPIMRVGDRRVDVRELRIALEPRRADDCSRLAERRRRPAGAEGVDASGALSPNSSTSTRHGG